VEATAPEVPSGLTSIKPHGDHETDLQGETHPQPSRCELLGNGLEGVENDSPTEKTAATVEGARPSAAAPARMAAIAHPTSDAPTIDPAPTTARSAAREAPIGKRAAARGRHRTPPRSPARALPKMRPAVLSSMYATVALDGVAWSAAGRYGVTTKLRTSIRTNPSTAKTGQSRNVAGPPEPHQCDHQ
jgi:hypothetical protein